MHMKITRSLWQPALAFAWVVSTTAASAAGMPGLTIQPDCGVGICTATSSVLSSFQQQKSCTASPTPCPGIDSATQCCAKNPKTGKNVAAPKQDTSPNTQFDLATFSKECANMKQRQAKPDAFWASCKVGQLQSPKDDYPMLVVKPFPGDPIARPYCIDGCSTPPSAVSTLYCLGIFPAKDRNDLTDVPAASFLNACSNHDICYQTCDASKSQSTCDKALLSQMQAACQNAPTTFWRVDSSGVPLTLRDGCLGPADAMYAGLVVEGTSGFTTPPQSVLPMLLSARTARPSRASAQHRRLAGALVLASLLGTGSTVAQEPGLGAPRLMAEQNLLPLGAVIEWPDQVLTLVADADGGVPVLLRGTPDKFSEVLPAPGLAGVRDIFSYLPSATASKRGLVFLAVTRLGPVILETDGAASRLLHREALDLDAPHVADLNGELWLAGQTAAKAPVVERLGADLKRLRSVTLPDTDEARATQIVGDRTGYYVLTEHIGQEDQTTLWKLSPAMKVLARKPLTARAASIAVTGGGIVVGYSGSTGPAVDLLDANLEPRWSVVLYTTSSIAPAARVSSSGTRIRVVSIDQGDLVVQWLAPDGRIERTRRSAQTADTHDTPWRFAVWPGASSPLLVAWMRTKDPSVWTYGLFDLGQGP